MPMSTQAPRKNPDDLADEDFQDIGGEGGAGGGA